MILNCLLNSCLLKGKSYLRVYPLNGETPGIRHFIGVLENVNIRGSGEGAEAVESASSTIVGGVGMGGVIGVADMSSSGLEPGTSEGETSSDSAGGSSATSARGRGALRYLYFRSITRHVFVLYIPINLFDINVFKRLILFYFRDING